MKKLIQPTNYTDSWQLAKESFYFLSQNKDLNIFLFLALGAVLLIVLTATYVFPDKGAFFEFKSYGVLIFLYFILAYILTFIQTAFMAVVLKRLTKGHASLFEGFKVASERCFSIFKWTLFANTVGLLAKILEGPLNLIEKLFGHTLGFCWSTASYFVLPLFVLNNASPREAMQKSAEGVGHGWKNTISIKVLITIFFVFVLLILSEFIGHPHEILSMVKLIAPVFLILYILGAALEAIVVSALFINVVQQKEPKHFDVSVLGRAFIKEED